MAESKIEMTIDEFMEENGKIFWRGEPDDTADEEFEYVNLNGSKLIKEGYYD